MTTPDSHQISKLHLLPLEAGCTNMEARRRLLNEGQIIALPVSDTSRLVIERAWRFITEIFSEEPRFAHKRLTRPQFLLCASEAKQAIFQDWELRNLLLEILCNSFNSRSGIRFDPPRLRVVPPGRASCRNRSPQPKMLSPAALRLRLVFCPSSVSTGIP